MSEQSKQVSLLSGKIIAAGQSSGSSADPKKLVQPAQVLSTKSSYISTSDRPSAMAIEADSQHLGNEEKMEECKPNLSLESSQIIGTRCSHPVKNGTAVSVASAFSCKSGHGSPPTATEASKTVCIITKERQIPSDFKLVSASNGYQISHNIIASRNSDNTAQYQPIPKPKSEKFVYSTDYLKKSSSDNRDGDYVHFEAFSQPTTRGKIQLSTFSDEVHALKLQTNKDGQDSSKIKATSAHNVTDKSPVRDDHTYFQPVSKAATRGTFQARRNTVMNEVSVLEIQSGRGMQDLAKQGSTCVEHAITKRPIKMSLQSPKHFVTPRLSQAAPVSLNQAHLKSQQVSRCAIQNINARKQPTSTAYTILKSAQPLCSPKMSFIANETPSSTLLTQTSVSLTPSTCITMPFLTSIISADSEQTFDGNKPQFALSTKTQSSEGSSQISYSQSVPKSADLSQAPPILLIESTVTSDQKANANTSQIPTQYTLVPFQSNKSNLSQHNAKWWLGSTESQSMKFISPKTIEGANCNINENKSEHLFSPQSKASNAQRTASTVMLTAAYTDEHSMDKSVRNPHPKTTSPVIPFDPVTKLITQHCKVTCRSSECHQNIFAQAQNSSQSSVKKVIIAKESLLNLSKIPQTAETSRVITKQNTCKSNSVVTVTSSISDTNSLPMSHTTETKKLTQVQTQAQPSTIASKSTRLSTATIPRQSYLKMLRHNVPREKGSVSLISRGNVNMKIGSKKEYVPLVMSQAATQVPVFVTSTLRTTSGPVSAKVRAPGFEDYSNVYLNAKGTIECQKHNIVKNRAQPLEANADIGNDFPDIKSNSLKENPEHLNRVNLLDMQRHWQPSGQCRSKEDSTSSLESDSDFLHDSEEQDIRVLDQLLQQNRLEDRVTIDDKVSQNDPNFSTNHIDLILTAKPYPLLSESCKEPKTSLEKCYEVRNDCVTSTSTLQNVSSDLEKKTSYETHDSVNGLRIESVFSLNSMTKSKTKIVGFMNPKEKAACNDPSSGKEGIVSRVLGSNDDFSVFRRDNTVTPCFCVLERLSKTDIVRLSSPKSSSSLQKLGSQCSIHCRKRMLTFMCNLNLLPCEFKSHSFSSRQNSKEVNDFASKNPTLKYDQIKKANSRSIPHMQLLKEKRNSLQHSLLDHHVLDQLKPKSMGKEISNKEAQLTNVSSRVENKAATQENYVELVEDNVSIETDHIETQSKPGDSACVYKTPNTSRGRKREGRSSLKSPHSSILQSSVYRRAIFKLRNQVEFKRRQMLNGKDSTSKWKGVKFTLPADVLSVDAPRPRKFGNLQRLIDPRIRFASKGRTKPAISTATSLPIVAQLLPSGLIRTKYNSPESKTRSHGRFEVSPTHNVKILPKPHNSLWSAKVAEALKSLRSYLETTGRHLRGTEAQQFLLRIEEQHVLVSLPPSEPSLSDPPSPNKITTPASSSGTCSSSSFSTSVSSINSKDSVEFGLEKTAAKRKVESLSNSYNQQNTSETTAGDCSEPKIFCEGKKYSILTSKRTKSRSLLNWSFNNPPCSEIPPVEASQKNPPVKSLLSFDAKDQSKLAPNTSSGHESQRIVPDQLPTTQINEVELRTTTSETANASSLRKQPLKYAGPPSIPSHFLPLDRSLLPTPNRDAVNALSDSERAYKRAILEKKYPLPNGVVVKVEPDTVCHDTPESFQSTPAGKDGNLKNEIVGYLSEENIRPRRNVNQLVANFKALPQIQNDLKPVADRGTQGGFENCETSIFGYESPHEVRKLIDEAPGLWRQQMRPRKRRLTRDLYQHTTVEQPPVLQPMCNPTPLIAQSSDKISSPCLDNFITEKHSSPLTFSQCHASQDPIKSQSFVSGSELFVSVSARPSVDSLELSQKPAQGFKATEVSVSKNIRIQRLKELLKKKEEVIETMRKIRFELPATHLELDNI